MKHKAVKIALIAAGTMIALGGVCLGAGLAMGGSPSFYYDENGIHVKEKAKAESRPDHVLEKTEISAVKNLELALANADLKIVSGKEWAVEYVLDGYRLEPEYSLEDQTLTIRENESRKKSGRRTFGIGHYWWYDGGQDSETAHVKLTIPDTAKLDQVRISSEYGNITIEKKLCAKTVCLDTPYGEVKLDGWEGNSLTLDMEYGELVTGTLEGKNLSVKNDNGTVRTGALRVENASFEMEYGDLSASVEAASSIEVENENGSVTLGLIGGMDKYGVSLHTAWGTIRTPLGLVEEDELEGNSDFIRMEGDTAGIRVYTEYGDIRVRDEA